MIGNKILEKAIGKAVNSANEDIGKYFHELNKELDLIKTDLKEIKETIKSEKNKTP